MSSMRSSTADRDAVEAVAARSVTKARTSGRRRFIPATVDESVDRGNGATLHDADAGAWIELHALEPAQMVGDDVPRRRARRLAETRPPRRLVAPRRLERLARHADVADTTVARGIRIDGVREAAEPHHVATLPVVRIAME